MISQKHFNFKAINKAIVWRCQYLKQFERSGYQQKVEKIYIFAGIEDSIFWFSKSAISLISRTTDAQG